jgi:hypothetical protein
MHTKYVKGGSFWQVRLEAVGKQVVEPYLAIENKASWRCYVRNHKRNRDECPGTTMVRRLEGAGGKLDERSHVKNKRPGGRADGRMGCPEAHKNLRGGNDIGNKEHCPNTE